MNYRCSECAHKIGWIEGLFKCHRSGKYAHTVPTYPQRRLTPPLPKDRESKDLSRLARKRKKEDV